MYPHGRSLVKKLAGRPFAIVGVNSDPSGYARKAVKDNRISWRSFWDGGDPQGPIASRWNVTGWPTMYLIDHKGRIVGSVWQGKELDALIEKHVKEAEADE